MTQETRDLIGVRLIRGDELLAALKRVRDGDKPHLVFAEMWANLERVKDPVEQGEGA